MWLDDARFMWRGFVDDIYASDRPRSLMGPQPGSAIVAHSALVDLCKLYFRLCGSIELLSPVKTKLNVLAMPF